MSDERANRPKRLLISAEVAVIGLCQEFTVVLEPVTFGVIQPSSDASYLCSFREVKSTTTPVELAIVAETHLEADRSGHVQSLLTTVAMQGAVGENLASSTSGLPVSCIVPPEVPRLLLKAAFGLLAQQIGSGHRHRAQCDPLGLRIRRIVLT